jgi:hypothetical protein
VVTDDTGARGLLSVRDVLLASGSSSPRQLGRAPGPLTFTIGERRQLQRYLLVLRDSPSEFELAGVLGLLVESWSFESRPSADAESIRSVPAADLELLRAAVIAELPDLQRAVHSSPGGVGDELAAPAGGRGALAEAGSSPGNEPAAWRI